MAFTAIPNGWRLSVNLAHLPPHLSGLGLSKAAQVFGFPLQGSAPGLQVFGAVVKKGHAMEPVRDELVKLVEGFADDPPNKQEIDRTRLSFLNQAEKTLANHESLGVQMSEYIALGDWRLFFLARDDLEKITSEQVAQASRAYFRRDNRTVGFFLPEDAPQRAEIPATPPLAEVMKDFKPKAATSVGPMTPRPIDSGNITSPSRRRARARAGPRRSRGRRAKAGNRTSPTWSPTWLLGSSARWLVSTTWHRIRGRKSTPPTPMG